VIAADLSPQFRAGMEARAAAEGLGNVQVVPCVEKDPCPGAAEGTIIDLAIMVPVYYEYIIMSILIVFSWMYICNNIVTS
jgi:hypothetical protein